MTHTDIEPPDAGARGAPATTAARLEACLSLLEGVQGAIADHLALIRAAPGRRASRSPDRPALSLAAALDRIEELELRLEDALAPPDPLPDAFAQRLSPLQRQLYALLKRKAQENPESYVRKQQIMTVLYGLADETPDSASLHVHVFHLRRKLPPGERIETIWGRGWRLVAPDLPRQRR